jgi:hypothetical protein
VQKVGSAAGVLALLSALALSAPAAAAPVTIGANVADTSGTAGVGCSPACTFQDITDGSVSMMQSPCTGVVTRWRVNAVISAPFKLRVIRANGDLTFTSTASSAEQTTSGAGIAEFPTTVPISVGEYIGLDVALGGSVLGRVLTGESSGNVFRPPMVDGVRQALEFQLSDAVLVNADIACPHPLTVIKAGTGLGTVTSEPVGISCGGICSDSYLDGTQVGLAAIAAPGSIFAGWAGGGCSGIGGCQLTMSSDQAVTAIFNTAPPGPSGARLAALHKCLREHKKAVQRKRANDALAPSVKHQLTKKLRKCRRLADQLPV